MTVILFGHEFTFDTEEIGDEVIQELAYSCDSLDEFMSLINAEEIGFVRIPCKYVSNNATHSDYQLSLLQG